MQKAKHTLERPGSLCITIFLGILFAGLVLMILILGAVPPVSRDALIHHLAIPKLYLKHGGIYETPELSFSYYPMNLDLLYLIPLYFKNDIFPKFIHFAFALITAAMVYRYLLRRLTREYALLGALFFLSIPIIVRLSGEVYVDLGLVCFLFAALLFIFHWVESGFQSKHLFIGAVCCGLALGTKYNGLIGLFLLTLFIAFVYSRYHAGQKRYGIKAISWAAAFAGVALIVFSPWMIRNALWTGNPVYPLYSSVFSSENQAENESISAAEHKKKSRVSHINIRKDLYDESMWEIVLIPIRVFFQGEDNDPKYFDGRASPFLLLLPIFAFFRIKDDTKQLRTEKMMMLFFSICFLLLACAQTSIRIRYFAPIIPPLVVLSMLGLYNIYTLILGAYLKVSDGVKIAFIFMLVLVMLGLNAVYMVNRFQYVRPMSYLTGEISRDAYIQQYRPEYACMRYANINLSPDAKILGVYVGNRGYFSDIPIVFNLDMLQQLAAKADSAIQVAQGLDEKNISHLLINFELFNFWVKNYNLHEKRILRDFFESHTVTEFSEAGYGLLRVTH